MWSHWQERFARKVRNLPLCIGIRRSHRNYVDPEGPGSRPMGAAQGHQRPSEAGQLGLLQAPLRSWMVPPGLDFYGHQQPAVLYQ